MAKSKNEIIQENLENIEKWALQGISEVEIAKYLNMGYSTFRKLKKENLALLALLKRCSQIKKETEKQRIGKVEKSLFKRATGYDVTETVPIKVKKTFFDTEGRKYIDEVVEIVSIIKYIPADVQAAKFFLTNKAKKTWQDNPHKVENDKENLKLKKEQMKEDEW